MAITRGYTSRGEEHPVESMIFSWVFCILLPAASIAWASTERWSVVCAVTLATPVLAILQGTIGILKYRAFFGDAPLPHTPSHGVVLVSSIDGPSESLTDDHTVASTTTSITTTTIGSIRINHPPSGHASNSPPERGAHGMTRSHQSFYADTEVIGVYSQSMPLTPNDLLPLRVLVIGDSLAIGVGQEKSATPVLPEAIAKTLSKQLGGRAVYWTCHGAPGASTAWIVREIERGVKHFAEQIDPPPSGGLYTALDCESSKSGKQSLAYMQHSNRGKHRDEGESQATESVNGLAPLQYSHEGFVAQDGTPNDMALRQWKDNLARHRKRFNQPDVLGPYDVIVVMTGANDLKSAFFPFLLSGEDKEFRRQARERGGSYTKELRRLLETLNEKMQRGLQQLHLNEKMQRRLESFRQRMEIATETIREKVEETIHYISPSSKSIKLRSDEIQSLNSSSQRLFFAEEEREERVHSGNGLGNERGQGGESTRNYPLVVLPGMPARSLPIFQTIPLRWLSIPIVDIMDMHKRNFAKAHPKEVLFIPAPSMKELADYERQSGESWEQRIREKTFLSLRDIGREESHRIEMSMDKYYRRKRDEPFFRLSQLPLLLWLINPMPGAQMFSIDNVHPQDDGYDFWGRYIGSSVAAELQRRMLSVLSPS